jgi:hypothetical protein
MKHVVKLECYNAVVRVGESSLVFAASTRGRTIVPGKPICFRWRRSGELLDCVHGCVIYLQQGGYNGQVTRYTSSTFAVNYNQGAHPWYISP